MYTYLEYNAIEGCVYRHNSEDNNVVAFDVVSSFMWVDCGDMTLSDLKAELEYFTEVTEEYIPRKRRVGLKIYDERRARGQASKRRGGQD